MVQDKRKMIFSDWVAKPIFWKETFTCIGWLQLICTIAKKAIF